MSIKIKIDKNCPDWHIYKKAADWIVDHNINCTMEENMEIFQKQFNLNVTQLHLGVYEIEFANKNDYLLFLIKWS